jgi:hypothetical protein
MVNRDSLIDYLLHQMPEPERLDFAERWFPDPDLGQQLEATEAELLDSYVRGELPRRQQERVERYLLNSDGQRRKLAFAAALHGVLPRRPRPQIPWAAVGAAAMFVILAGATLWVARQNRELRSEVAKLQQNVRPLSGGVYSASLMSSLRGSSAGTPLALPKNATMLRLDLELSEGDAHETYSAILSISGRTLWSEQPLRAETGGSASFVTVWIPTHLLDAGDYTIELESSGNPVAYYNLKINARPAP